MFNIQNRILVGIMLSVIAMLTALSILAFVQNQSFSDSIIVGDVEYDTHTPNYSTNIVFSDNLRNGGWMTMSARLMQSDFIDTEKVNGVDFNAEILLQDGTVVTSSSDHFSGRADGSSVQLAGNARIEVEDTHTVSSDSIRYDEASQVIATESLTFLRFPGGIATVGKLIANFPDDDSDNGTEYDLSEGVNIVLYRE